MNEQKIKKQLIQLKDKLRFQAMGDWSGDIEEEIFAELDLTLAYINSKLLKLEKEDKVEWDSKILKDSLSRLKKFVKMRGERNFKKNKILFKNYELCIEAISLMSKLK